MKYKYFITNEEYDDIVRYDIIDIDYNRLISLAPISKINNGDKLLYLTRDFKYKLRYIITRKSKDGATLYRYKTLYEKVLDFLNEIWNF